MANRLPDRAALHAGGHGHGYQESIAAWAVYPSAQAHFAVITAAASPQTATLNGSDQLSPVAFSPDGKTLAIISDNGTAQLRNTATGQQMALAELEPPGPAPRSGRPGRSGPPGRRGCRTLSQDAPVTGR